MNLEPILSFARSLLNKAVQEGDTVIDGTAGNGHDTLFLAGLVGDSGHVFSFDIQSKAIQNTETKVKDAGFSSRVTLFQTGHEKADSLIPEERRTRISGAIFNLGYLPGGDKSVVTKPETTMMAIEQLAQLLVKGGIIVLVVYHGHEEGKVERDELLDYVENLDQRHFHVLRYGFINQKNHPPFLIALEKR